MIEMTASECQGLLHQTVNAGKPIDWKWPGRGSPRATQERVPVKSRSSACCSMIVLFSLYSACKATSCCALRWSDGAKTQPEKFGTIPQRISNKDSLAFTTDMPVSCRLLWLSCYPNGLVPIQQSHKPVDRESLLASWIKSLGTHATTQRAP